MTKALFLAAFFLSFASIARAQDEQPQEWDGRVTAVSGGVTLFEVGGDTQGVPAAEGMPLQEGDRIRTAQEGSAELALDGESVIKLGPNTDFKLENLHRSETLFGLVTGTFLAKIKKLLPSQSMQVRAPAAVAAVRGTEFGVEVAEDGQDHFGVFDEGKVEVKGAGGTETLIGNQETRVGADGKPASPYQLQRFMRHRAAVRGFRRRLAALRKSWKPLAPAERAAKRKQVLEFQRRRRQQRLRRNGDLRQVPRQRRSDKEREKMEKFRERIQREHGGR